MRARPQRTLGRARVLWIGMLDGPSRPKNKARRQAVPPNTQQHLCFSASLPLKNRDGASPGLCSDGALGRPAACAPFQAPSCPLFHSPGGRHSSVREPAYLSAQNSTPCTCLLYTRTSAASPSTHALRAVRACVCGRAGGRISFAVCMGLWLCGCKCQTPT